MPNKIVFEGKTKKDRTIVVRYPRKGDAQLMCDYINAVSKEKTYIVFQGEEISLKDELKYLNHNLKLIKNKKGIQLLVICDDKVVGMSEIIMGEMIENHVGKLGISVAKDYRGEGVGKILFKLVNEEAEKNLPQLKIVMLGVFGNNSLAHQLYKSFGFQEYGNFPKSVFHRGQYVDHIYMYKNVGCF